MSQFDSEPRTVSRSHSPATSRNEAWDGRNQMNFDLTPICLDSDEETATDEYRPLWCHYTALPSKEVVLVLQRSGLYAKRCNQVASNTTLP